MVGRNGSVEFEAQVQALVERARVALDNAPTTSAAAREAADRKDFRQWNAELEPWFAKARASREAERNGGADSRRKSVAMPERANGSAPARAEVTPHASGATVASVSEDADAASAGVGVEIAGDVAFTERDEHNVAVRGTTGAGDTLPHLETIQRAFGRHDVSSVRAFVGGNAATASAALGASAYAYGNSIAFGSAPDLHTAAHEAAHIVQQRKGVPRTLGGDHSFEAHADLVADRVVRGQSAEALLDRLSGSGRAVPIVQLKKGGTSERSHSQDRMWAELAPGENSVSVQLISRIDAPKGVYLRSHPAGDKDGTLLPFGTLVAVSRRTDKGWYFVTVIPDSAAESAEVLAVPAGEHGFIESYHVASSMPEPTARLHLVGTGEHLKDIAAQYYKHGFAWGHDARVFVQAIYHANKDRAAVFRKKANLSVNEEALNTKSLDRALELWGQARVVSGQALWMPSHAFVNQLKASGLIHQASISKTLWDSTAGALSDAWDFVKYAAGFAIEILEGAWSALEELFRGVVDLVKMIWTVIKDIFNDFAAIKALAKQISEAWNNRDAIIQQIAAEFMDKWEHKDDYTRGNFQGEFLGYVMMTAFITLATLGAGAAIAGVGRFGSFVRLIRFADEIGSVGTYVAKLKSTVRLPKTVVDKSRAALGKATHIDASGNRPHGHGVEGSSSHADARKSSDGPQVDKAESAHAHRRQTSSEALDVRARHPREATVATAKAETPTSGRDRQSGRSTKLSRRQLAIADKLPNQGSTYTFAKKEVSMADLRALTHATGDEYSMYTQGAKRLIIRGYGNQVRVPEQLAMDLVAGRHGKWSGHTHPPGYGKSPGPADRPNIPAIQERSAIWADDGVEVFHRTPQEDYMFQQDKRRLEFRRMYGN